MFIRKIPVDAIAPQPINAHQHTDLLTASSDGAIRLWTVEGNELHLLTEMVHDEALSEIQFSPDGQRIAAALQNGDVQLWTIAAQALTTLEGNDGALIGSL